LSESGGDHLFGEENENSEMEVVDSAVEVVGDSTERKPLSAVEQPDHKWYVINAFSGMEYKAKLSLEERVKSHGMEHLVSEVIVPEETVVELVKGQKKTTKRKFFPGYLLVKMKLSNESWHLIKDTPKISGFVGDKRNPAPVPESEILRMTNRISEGASRPKPKTNFQEGEKVRVVDGPFNNFNGVIEDVNTDKGKIRVLVSIFGRSTPVELDFIQVEKV
jgi:transcription termination/antitermination protein NusG